MKLKEWIKQFKEKKIIVYGDLVADVYLDGQIARISREAPVFVLEQEREIMVPGGAANTVHNVATLGGDAMAVGVVGDDRIGEELIRVLESKRVNCSGVVTDATRPTISKTRITAGGEATVRQQVVRIDREKKEPLAAPLEEALIGQLLKNIETAGAVVISDYGSHTVGVQARQVALKLCRENGIPCIVDSRYDILSFKGATLVKQNTAETAAAVGYHLDDEAAVERAGKDLLAKLQGEAVLITRGPEGMSLFLKDGAVHHIPVTNRSEVFDVSGAGDTVVATMALAFAAGASMLEAAVLANYAAGIVVRKLGTATTNPAELKKAIEEKHETK
ncbi:bifunctional heptose 7-phosphate kinase/heptose 1-phosphate adenyltransferase [Azotosporobacter soli]|uniref:bifunctional heptose 7-phosphate kinase/heptose 1-phosphate adenyltransferase n=1 Tax=Azotosporobacter soli TaxID=3055040 RepID=UPI0031FF2D55